MSAGVFSARPLDAKTILYCVNDVNHLPALQAVYERRIWPLWLAKAKDHSQRRAVEACSPSYDPQSPDKARGPWAGPKPTAKDDLEDQLSDHLEAFWDREPDLEDQLSDWQDDGPRCSADVGDFGGAFDECWDKY